MLMKVALNWWQQHYKSLQTHKIYTTRVKWTFSNQPIRLRRVHSLYLHGFLEYWKLLCSVFEAGILVFENVSITRIWCFFGSWFQWLVVRFVWEELHQAGGACLNPCACQCLSAEPGSDCPTAMEQSGFGPKNGNEEMNTGTWKNGAGFFLLQHVWKTRSVSNLHFQLWVANKSAWLQDKLGVRKMSLGALRSQGMEHSPAPALVPWWLQPADFRLNSRLQTW